jgi:putative acetyltransferase
MALVCANTFTAWPEGLNRGWMPADIRRVPRELPLIRDARDSDGGEIARLIAACFAEYPGCIFDMAEFPELAAPATHFAGRGGRLWVAISPENEVVGSIAATPVQGSHTVELTKMYAAVSWRGAGLAQALYDRLEAFADDLGADEIMLWSDVLFTRAHAFYGRLGFVRQAGTRLLADISNTKEFQFRLKRATADKRS